MLSVRKDTLLLSQCKAIKTEDKKHVKVFAQSVDPFCFFMYSKSHLRNVAQLVARLLWEQNVAGSNPVVPKKEELHR